MKILAATGNKGKIREIKEILEGVGVTIVTPSQIGVNLDVVEDGDSFEANAVKKAQAFRAATGLACLADDSGLCVDALGGRPGVYSARFAGPEATDADNIRALLEQLSGVSDRNAHFVCVMALALENGEIVTARGECHGTIIDAPRGAGGFGYDPIFLEPVSGKSFAELSQEEKNRISHRKRALSAMREKLEGLS